MVAVSVRLAEEAISAFTSERVVKGRGHEVWRYGDDIHAWLASLRARGSGIDDAP
jgi:hypothetical protein